MYGAGAGFVGRAHHRSRAKILVATLSVVSSVVVGRSDVWRIDDLLTPRNYRNVSVKSNRCHNFTIFNPASVTGGQPICICVWASPTLFAASPSPRAGHAARRGAPAAPFTAKGMKEGVAMAPSKDAKKLRRVAEKKGRAETRQVSGGRD